MIKLSLWNRNGPDRLCTAKVCSNTLILLCLLLAGAADARPGDPDIPAISRPVHLTDNQNHELPYIPVYRTTHDGRVGFNFKLGIRLYLMNPEKIRNNFHSSANGPALLADTQAFTIRKRRITGSDRYQQNHIGICEPPNANGEFTNPRACGNDDCYDIVFFSASLEPGSGTRRQLWGTPATVRVSNPKTPNARITNVQIGQPVGGRERFTFSELFEPMFTDDGNLLIGRIQGAQISWNNRRTGNNVTGNYNMVYFPAPRNFSRACDVNQWDEIKPLGHAPYDPEINQTYGFARQRFRDSLGNIIPDGTDLSGTYPWIDSKGTNIAFSSFGTRINGDFPMSCVSGRACADNNLANNPNNHMGKTIVGLWTKGKMILMDNLVNNIDYSQPQMEDSGHRMLDMYRANSGRNGSGTGLVRVGNGRDNGNNNGAGLPAGSPINTTFTESLENKMNYWENMKPVTPRDVVWHMSNGAGSDEFVFDDYLYNNSFIVSSMVQAVRNNGNTVQQFNGIGNSPARVQNGAVSDRWNVPVFGNVVGTRIERVALGGIHGKGMWMSNSSHIAYNLPQQPRNIRDANWHISLFVDARFNNDDTTRVLLAFPDGSELQLVGRNRVRYWDQNNLRTINLPRVLPRVGWAHLGVQMSNRNRTATLYYNGFALDTYNRGSAFFEMSQGALLVGDNPNRGNQGFRGWIDDFKVIAHRSNAEEWCNHANGSLIGFDQTGGNWYNIAEGYPQSSHQTLTNLLNNNGKETYSRYACYHNYSGDYAAHPGNIPDGTSPIRESIHFPEGPLRFDEPRPNSRQNGFCLACHSNDNIAGLRLAALNFNPNLIAADDPRRQPMQPYPRVHGNIPANWLGAGLPAQRMVAPAGGLRIDELLMDGDASNPPPLSNSGRIVVRNGGLCIDIASRSQDNGANAQQWTCHNNDNQQFEAIDVGGGYVELRAQHSGRCLNVAGISNNDGANILQWDCRNNNNQSYNNSQFRMQDQGGGWFSLVARHSGKCLHIADRSTAPGANLMQWACHGGTNQQFRFD